MKHRILPCAVALFSLSFLQAQQENKVFAITSDNSSAGQPLWMNINEVDLNSGKVTRPLYDRARTSYILYDGISKTKLPADELTVNGNTYKTTQYPTSTMVAAAAYDQRRNRLFITPMQLPELRWIDLDDNNTTLKVYCVKFPFMTSADLTNDANQITRMVIGADGYGYALTNDANHLIRFSTGRKLTITDMGALHDAAANGAVSVHNRCSSFGGDMVADADGSLYLISAYHAIFKIDVNDNTASYTGTIKNLPGDYTTNGAAIDNDGNLIVSSANSKEGYFKVNMTTWEAVKLAGANQAYSISDLASSHLAFEKKQTSNNISPIVFTKPVEQLNKVTVYPNPVTEGIFRVSFDNKETGRYQVQVLDLTGKVSLQRAITVNNKSQLVEIDVPARLSRGMYMIKVLNATGRVMYTNKILLE